MQNHFSEVSRSSILTTKIEDTSFAWNNSYLATRTEEGIHIYGFSKNLKCLDKKVDFNETFISTPLTSPCSEMILKKIAKTKPKNKDMSEMVLDTALWSHSQYLSEEMNSVVAFAWSPKGFTRNKESILAIVNIIGGVELYIHGRHEWKSVLDLSISIKEQFREIIEANHSSFQDLKQAVYKLEACSVCWSPILDKASCLVTGQKNGSLQFWMVNHKDEITTAKFCGQFDTELGETTSLVWIPKSDKEFVLICTNIIGQIAAFECTISKEIVVLKKSHMLWEHQDRMIVQHIQANTIDNQLLLVFAKHRHVVILLMDKDLKMVSQIIKNLNEYRITCIAKNADDFYISTVNFKLYRLHINIDKSVLNVDYELIEIKDINFTYDLYSVSFSENNIFCALSMVDRKILHRKERLKLETLFLQVSPQNIELEILLDNPTKQFNNYWDCIEMLRYKMAKTRTLPEVDYKLLLSEGNEDVYKLKIYLIILTIYKNLQKSIKILKICMPEESIEVIKDKILVEHAKANIQTENKPLNNLDQECYIGSTNFIQMYSQKYNISLNKLIAPNKLDLTENISYSCQNCDEEITNFVCRNGHINMFCMLTFTPIESLDYLSCTNCNTTARIELKYDKPMCIFCDSYLEDVEYE